MNLDVYAFLEDKRTELLAKGKVALNLKVKPNAKRTFIKELRSDLVTISLYLKSPAINNQANNEAKEVLADYFKVSKKMIQIKSGEKSSFKLVFITID